MLDEGQELPQLIIVDGGKGQLSSAVHALTELGLYGKVAIVGIAKKLEEIYFPGDTLPLYINKKSESLKLIQRMRDEAHRFGITHHRKRRSNTAVESELTKIKGIGEKTSLSFFIDLYFCSSISKVFSPSTINVGGTSLLTIGITNNHALTSATLTTAFVDLYPGGLVNAAPSSVATIGCSLCQYP